MNRDDCNREQANGADDQAAVDRARARSKAAQADCDPRDGCPSCGRRWQHTPDCAMPGWKHPMLRPALAHVDPSPTLPPPSHDDQADELGPVAELRPDGQGGRAPAGIRPRVRVEVLEVACRVQGWKLSAASDGSWFVVMSEQASVRYECPMLPQMTARGPFDEVLDMIAVVAAAALD